MFKFFSEPADVQLSVGFPVILFKGLCQTMDRIGIVIHQEEASLITILYVLSEVQQLAGAYLSGHDVFLFLDEVSFNN